jgi:hypothetical protein
MVNAEDEIISPLSILKKQLIISSSPSSSSSSTTTSIPINTSYLKEEKSAISSVSPTLLLQSEASSPETKANSTSTISTLLMVPLVSSLSNATTSSSSTSSSNPEGIMNKQLKPYDIRVASSLVPFSMTSSSFPSSSSSPFRLSSLQSPDSPVGYIDVSNSLEFSDMKALNSSAMMGVSNPILSPSPRIYKSQSQHRNSSSFSSSSTSFPSSSSSFPSSSFSFPSSSSFKHDENSREKKSSFFEKETCIKSHKEGEKKENKKNIVFNLKLAPLKNCGNKKQQVNNDMSIHDLNRKIGKENYFVESNKFEEEKE